MNNPKNLIIALLAIVLVVLVYMLVTEEKPIQNSQNTNTNSQNVTEPPPPSPQPSPEPSPGPSPVPSQPSKEEFAKNWLILSAKVKGQVIDMDVNVPRALTLNFDAATDSYSGFAGCNNFSGKYSASGTDQFSFGATAATKMYCMESSDLESKLFEAMNAISRFEISPKGNLILYSGDGKTQIEYKPAI